MQENINDLDVDEDDFNHIANEIKRQYDVELRIDDSLDTKTGIILGFIFIVTAQILLNKDFIILATKDLPHIAIFAIGFFSIVLSICMGLCAYFVRKYKLGPEIYELIGLYNNVDEDIDFSELIPIQINKAIEENGIMLTSKSKYVKLMLIAFFIGVMWIAITEIIYFSKLW